jgi:hypothetical protein
VLQGYTAELATFLTEDADEDMIPHRTLSQWAVVFLDYASKTWASKVAERSQNLTRPEEQHWSIPRRIHLKEYVDISNLSIQFDKFRKDSQHWVLLHFTTECDAESIQQEITLQWCKNFAEFAIYGAFHLTDSVEYGLKWLRTRHRSKEWAVLLFEIPDSYFQEHRCICLKGRKWKRFCYHNCNQIPE